MAEWQASRYPGIQVSRHPGIQASSAGASLGDLILFNSIAIIDFLSCPECNFVPPEVGRCLKGNCLRGVLWSPGLLSDLCSKVLQPHGIRITTLEAGIWYDLMVVKCCEFELLGDLFFASGMSWLKHQTPGDCICHFYNRLPRVTFRATYQLSLVAYHIFHHLIYVYSRGFTRFSWVLLQGYIIYLVIIRSGLWIVSIV